MECMLLYSIASPEAGTRGQSSEGGRGGLGFGHVLTGVGHLLGAAWVWKKMLPFDGEVVIGVGRQPARAQND